MDFVKYKTNLNKFTNNKLLNYRKNHRHYVDIFIPTQNRCIEVKSTLTAKLNEHNIYLKQESAKIRIYEIWIYNEKEEKINCYE